MKLDVAASAVEGINPPSFVNQRKFRKFSGLKALSKKQDKDFLKRLKFQPSLLKEALTRLNPNHNKFFILLTLNRSQMLPLMDIMDKAVLIQGLRFFPKELLIKMIFALPKIVMLKMILRFVPLRQFIKLASKAGLLKMLKHPELPYPKLLKGLIVLSNEELQLLGKNIFKQEFKDTPRKELLKILFGVNRSSMFEGFKKMPKLSLMKMTFFQARENPIILTAMPDLDIAKLFEKISKRAILMMMSTLSELFLLPMMDQLPDKAMAYTLSFMQDRQFTDIMLTKFPDTIAHLCQDAA